jgi:hypothetical protein
MAETEIDWIEDDVKIKKQTDIDRHGTDIQGQPASRPPLFHFTLPFKKNFIYVWDSGLRVLVPNDVRGAAMTS